MPIQPYVRMVKQENPADCGLVALAMYLGLKYEEVFAVSVQRKRDKDVREKGMYTKDFLRIAKRLGYTLKLKRSIDYDEDTGIVSVEKLEADGALFSQHVVLLRFGLFFDTDLSVWEPSDYLDAEKVRFISLLTLA